MNVDVGQGAPQGAAVAVVRVRPYDERNANVPVWESSGNSRVGQKITPEAASNVIIHATKANTPIRPLRTDHPDEYFGLAQPNNVTIDPLVAVLACKSVMIDPYFVGRRRHVVRIGL